ETRVAPRATLAVGPEVVTGQSAALAGEREVVLPFVLVALAAVLLEGFAFHRRW
ncbi:hypothetical protein HY251_11220, partial [bacterium]|nr:hypothetical protein [bacterium]